MLRPWAWRAGAPASSADVEYRTGRSNIGELDGSASQSYGQTDDDGLGVTGQRMQAIVQNEYGTADVLRVAEIERPSIRADEVLVQVRAAGLDRGTWHLMAGMPYAARLAVGLRAPKNPVPGLDVGGCGGCGRQ